MICRPVVRAAARAPSRPVVTPVAHALRQLFAANEPGFILDPNDFSTMFQDSAGMVPVTAHDQPIGLWLDKSRGLARGAERVANPSFDDGFTGWAPYGTNATNTVVASAGKVTLTTDGTNVGFYQPTLEAGKAYIAEVEILAQNGAIPGIFTGSADIAFSPGPGVKRVFFVAGNNNVTIKRTGTAAGNFEVGAVSVREIPGTHFHQPTAAARPLLRRSPILGPEMADASRIVAGYGTLSGYRFTSDGTQWGGYVGHDKAVVAGKSYELVVKYASSADASLPHVRVWGKNADSSYPLIHIAAVTAGTTGTAIATVTAPTNSLRVGVQIAAGAGTWVEMPDVSIKEITGYYTDRYAPEFDGVDDFLVSVTNLNMTATDKVTVFAGVRKLSDAAIGAAVHHGPAGASGIFGMLVPLSTFTGTSSFRVTGSDAVVAEVQAIPSVLGPESVVLTGSANLSAPPGTQLSVRKNGGAATVGGTTSGGSLGNHALYVGMRAGTSLPFKGYLYGLTVVGRLTTDAETRNAERIYAQRTGVTLQ